MLNMSWVFCTKCFIKPVQDNKRKYFITSCSHILCDHCANPSDSLCHRCQTPCRMVLINNEMPDEVKDVFSDVTEKATTLIRVMEFQEWHRSRLMNYYRTVAHKYDAAKLYIKDLEIKFTTILQKYESAKMKIKEQEKAVQDIKRKLSYKQNYGSCRTPISTQPLVELDFEASPFSGKTPMNSTGNLTCSKQAEDIFTPSYSMYRNPIHPPFTPDSSGSVRSSLVGSMSSYSGRNRLLPGYTPPSKTMELLTLLNKSRNQKYKP